MVRTRQTTLKTLLLRDIRRVFEQQGDKEALRSHDLLAFLIQDAEAPWAEYGTKGLNAYHLANLLRDFGISPANHRFETGRQAKAYARNQFLDAWARYCPDPAQSASAAGEPALARRAQGKPPAPPSGALPIGPRGGLPDLRTAQHFTLKQNPLTRSHLEDFVQCYKPDEDRAKRVETERFKSFTYDELIARDKANLDITCGCVIRASTMWAVFLLLRYWRPRSSRNSKLPCRSSLRLPRRWSRPRLIAIRLTERGQITKRTGSSSVRSWSAG